ncbi:hypothetical protein KP509_06G014300 [Ceratopteris richardii]|nr:hypothetical protein KP509_06G014300 [Ceratopteris richardii]
MEQCDDIFMDAVIYVSGLKACSSTNAIEKGKEMHDGIIKRGFEGHLATGSILVDMYAKCGFLEEAQKVFEKLKFQDVVSWTALIGGYAARGFSEETLNLFQEMKHKDISPDAGTYVCCLQVCGDMKTSYNWWELHSDIVKAGFDKDIFVSSTLVYMLAKCGLLDEAQRVFDRAAVHNMVIWTALITGYADLGHNDKALDCCYQMQKEGISLASATLICGLKGCGSSGSIKQGRMLHLEIAKKGLDTELNVANTLVDMYAKCGHLADAEEVFCKLQSCSLISWTALITGYAQLGNGKAVFDTFKRMLAEGLQPNFVTLISLLSVCSHAGLLTEGLLYFYYAIHEYNLIPCVEHYTCIADLLGRAGHIDKAVTLIQKMPCHPSIGLWLSVLGACKKWGDTNLGQVAFENMIQLDDRVSAAYIDMHNIYADIRAQ